MTGVVSNTLDGTPVNEAIADRIETAYGHRPAPGDTGFVVFGGSAPGDAVFHANESHLNRILAKFTTTSRTGVRTFNLHGSTGIYPVAVPIYPDGTGILSNQRSLVPVSVGLRLKSNTQAEVYWDLGSSDTSSRLSAGSEAQRCSRATIWVLGVA